MLYVAFRLPTLISNFSFRQETLWMCYWEFSYLCCRRIFAKGAAEELLSFSFLSFNEWKLLAAFKKNDFFKRWRRGIFPLFVGNFFFRLLKWRVWVCVDSWTFNLALSQEVQVHWLLKAWPGTLIVCERKPKNRKSLTNNSSPRGTSERFPKRVEPRGSSNGFWLMFWWWSKKRPRFTLDAFQRFRY